MSGLKERIEAACTTLGYEFDYGRADFQNLNSNLDVNKTYLMLDPIRRKVVRGGTGSVRGYVYRGHFMLLRKSSLDEVYSGAEDAKYEKHISPLYTALDALDLNLLGCSLDYQTEFESTEIVNVFSENMDGLVVNYTITHWI
tara:strand:+ start:3685 stop:4110 length:426 start_codon:yes stop_codon:yes gene_type:complete